MVGAESLFPKTVISDDGGKDAFGGTQPNGKRVSSKAHQHLRAGEGIGENLVGRAIAKRSQSILLLRSAGQLSV